jgi:hypothetical protein
MGLQERADGKQDRTDILASDFSMATPPPVDIPAMICQPEKNYYYWLASNHAPGVGAVVEVGTWLGASTAHLSAGLRGRPIHCYDYFYWFAYYNTVSGLKLKDGVDFSDLFLSNMARYGANVKAHKALIHDIVWDEGPVELLAFDASKYAVDLEKLLTIFAPSLIPGQTRILLQDYQYFPGYQIAVTMDAIRSSVVLEHVVVAVGNNLQPNTVGFLVQAPIDTAALAEAVTTFETWSVERIHETWSRIMQPLPDQVRARMAPGLALFLYDAGHQDEALSVLDATPMDHIMLNRWERMVTAETAGRVEGVEVGQQAARPDIFGERLFAERYPRLVERMEATRLNPQLRAAQKAAGAARKSGDESKLVEALIALLGITPDDGAARDRLATAALRAHQEQRVLDWLARHAQADLSAPKIETLHERVYLTCADALSAGDRDLAHKCFETLALVDDAHPRLESLRASLAEAPAARP